MTSHGTYNTASLRNLVKTKVSWYFLHPLTILLTNKSILFVNKQSGRVKTKKLVLLSEEKKIDREIKRVLWLEEVIKLADISKSTTIHGVQQSHERETSSWLTQLLCHHAWERELSHHETSSLKVPLQYLVMSFYLRKVMEGTSRKEHHFQGDQSLACNMACKLSFFLFLFSTSFVSQLTHDFKFFKFGTSTIRELVSDYAVPSSVLIFSMISFYMQFKLNTMSCLEPETSKWLL